MAGEPAFGGAKGDQGGQVRDASRRPFDERLGPELTAQWLEGEDKSSGYGV